MVARVELGSLMAWRAVELLSLAQLLLMFVLRAGAKVPAIIVFGDSTVDSGNNNNISTVLKSNFQPYGRDFHGGQPTGRFSNGRLPTDFISEAFGIKPAVPAYLDPAYSIDDFVTGVCFASAGTGYDNATSDVLSVIPLWKELVYYRDYQMKLRKRLGEDNANEILSQALYLISIGTNDFLENYFVLPQRSNQYSVVEYQSFLLQIARDFLSELYNLGARKVSITGLPPMGCLPLERTTNMMSRSECIEKYNDVAKDFNVKLNGMVMELNMELAGLQLVVSSTYDILLDMIRNPQLFGFKNAARACCGTGLIEMSYMCNKRNPFTCPDANKHVFWDSFHPTEKTNAIIADYLMKQYLSEFL